MSEFDEEEDEEILFPTHGVLNPEWMLREIASRASFSMIYQGVIGLAEFFMENHPFQTYGSDEVSDVLIQCMFLGEYTSPLPEEPSTPEDETQFTEEDVERFAKLLDSFPDGEYTKGEQDNTEEGENNDD